jgi:hypothetical protein
MRSVTMTTQKTVAWASWRWANPLWWAEHQLEATRFAVHVTAAVFNASLSSIYGPLPRLRLAASTCSAPASQAVTAALTVAPWERQLKAAEPHRELQTAAPRADLQPAVPAAELVPVPAQAGLNLVTAPADREAVILDAEPTARPEADAERSTPPVPGWDELTLGSIRARLRRFSEGDLVALHSYEEAHGARADVLSMLENRLAKVRTAEAS